MIPETRAFCPKGLGIVPYELPGSERLADRTIEQLGDYDVVMWEKHGALAVGEDPVEAFDHDRYAFQVGADLPHGAGHGFRTGRDDRRTDG